MPVQTVCTTVHAGEQRGRFPGWSRLWKLWKTSLCTAREGIGLVENAMARSVVDVATNNFFV